jgi:glycosyltransferase involved in cell wall biosynthesis
LADVDRLQEFVHAPFAAAKSLSSYSRFRSGAVSVARARTAAGARAATGAAPSGPDAVRGGRRTRGVEPPQQNDAPLVTVATVTLNCEDVIEGTIASAITQDYPNLEVMVVDGRSTDGTIDCIRRYEDELALWVSRPDEGPYDAMNAAADLATGEYILFLNAGDWFVGESALSDLLRNAPRSADFVVGHHIYRTRDGVEELHKANDFDLTWERLQRGDLDPSWLSGIPCHQATLARTELLRAERYDLRYRIAADHEFMYRERQLGASFHHSDTVVAVYASGGYSSQNEARCFAEWLELASHYGTAAGAERFFRPLIRSNRPLTRARAAVARRLAGRGFVGRVTRRFCEPVSRFFGRVSAAIRLRWAIFRGRWGLKRWKLRLTARRVRRSGLFFEQWYVGRYPDVAASFADPVMHYLEQGAEQRRDPSPFFDTAFYVDANAQVRVAGTNPLVHYLEVGAKAGLMPCAEFDRFRPLVVDGDRGAQPQLRVLVDWLAEARLEDIACDWPSRDGSGETST